MSKFYLYIFLDPRKPGRFIYENLECSFLYQPYYVGKGSSDRIYRHFDFIGEKRKHNLALYNKIDKIKRLGFNPKLYAYKHYEFISEESAFILEQKFIKNIGRMDLKTGTLVNLTEGGEGNAGILSKYIGKTLDEIHGKEKANTIREKMSNRLSGEKNPMFGKTPHNLGKRHEVETRAKMSDKKARKLKQLDYNNNVIKIWNKIKDAASSVNITSDTIRLALNPNSTNQTAGGFKWEWLDTPNLKNLEPLEEEDRQNFNTNLFNATQSFSYIVSYGCFCIFYCL